MRHLRLLMLCLVFCGLAVLLFSGDVLAQGGGDAPADYAGRAECSSCHRGLSRDHAEGLHANALIATTAEGTGIVADFATGEAERTLQLPGESDTRPFTLADTVYTMGAGRYAQRFIVEDTDGTLLVLPVEWNAVDAQWQPFELAESWPDPAYNFVENCAYCHTAGLDRDTGEWVDDGVQCEACHGPGTTHIDLANDAGFRPSTADLTAIRGAIHNLPDSQVCGQCHSAGTAPDGRPYPLGYLPGNVLVDEAVFTLSDPATDSVHWWATGVHGKDVNMQFNEWRTTAHANLPTELQELDYASDDCLRCHSGDYRYNQRVLGWFEDGSLDGEPPAPVTLENAAQGIVCQTCHNPHNEDNAQFLLWDEPYALCVECHSNTGIEGAVHHPNLEMYEGLSLTDEIAGIPSAHFTAEDGPDCVSCHMPRLPASEGDRASHAMVGILPGAPAELEAVAGCTSCHTDVTVEQIADFITQSQENTTGRLAAAQAALTDSAPAWVETALAMVDGDGSGGLHNYTYAQVLLNAAEAELGLLPDPDAEDATAEQAPEWVDLPLLGVVEGLTMPGLVIIVVTVLVLGVAGLILLFAPAWRKAVGMLLLVVAAAIATSPWWALEVPSEQVEASGDNGYCLLCHSGERTFTLADGNNLVLNVSLEAMSESVHGDASPMGTLGCLDCHGADTFPHGPAPTNLREYRLAGVSLCTDCHLDSMDHYQDVLDDGIAVGCVDCHGAHDVMPAELLENYTPARIIPTEGPEVAPADMTLPSRENPMREGPPVTATPGL